MDDTTAQRLGAVLQGLVLGVLLLASLRAWVLLVDGASVFRYQGF